MSEATIEVQRRERVGSGEARRLRSRDLIPAVLYGADREPIAIQVPRKTLLDLFKAGGHENRIFLLRLAGTDQTRHAMVRDLQVNPTTNEISHLDFQRIAMDRTLRVKVHLELQGVPTGVKDEGGVLDFVTREIEIECLPSAIPASIPCDVTALQIGQHLEARELVLPAGVEYLGAADTVIASVKHARVEEVAAPVAVPSEEAAAAEPEVIARGKKEEVPES
ncbi:MAG TPA: 50S ribosomal protein L25 [Thermoanaerobaculia bacterium]|nr:50S ribosomal protein L25 [Thermoanaerobaculia bacterium]